jgi:hypothetical protein
VRGLPVPGRRGVFFGRILYEEIQSMGKIDVICGLITGAFSILFYIGTLSFPEMSIGINPRAYPMVIIAAAFGFSLLLIVQGALKMRRKNATSR